MLRILKKGLCTNWLNIERCLFLLYRLRQKGMARMPTLQSPVNRRKTSLTAHPVPLTLKTDDETSSEVSRMTIYVYSELF